MPKTKSPAPPAPTKPIVLYNHFGVCRGGGGPPPPPLWGWVLTRIGPRDHNTCTSTYRHLRTQTHRGCCCTVRSPCLAQPPLRLALCRPIDPQRIALLEIARLMASGAHTIGSPAAKMPGTAATIRCQTPVNHPKKHPPIKSHTTPQNHSCLYSWRPMDGCSFPDVCKDCIMRPTPRATPHPPTHPHASTKRPGLLVCVSHAAVVLSAWTICAQGICGRCARRRYVCAYLMRKCHGPQPPQTLLCQTCPLCDIPYGCCSFTGPWTVTRSSLHMLRRVAAFCRPLRPVLLLVSFPRSGSPVVGVLGLC